MKSILSIISIVFETEFKKLYNVIGWIATSSIWMVTNIEKVNNILTAFLTLCSIAWIIIKIILAIRGKKNDSD